MFKRNLIWFGSLLLLCQGVSAWCSPLSELPFKSRAGLIWVQVDNPRGGKPLQFILDSGAEASVIDFKTAQRLHLCLGQPVTVRGINSTTSGYWTESASVRMGGVDLPTNFLAMDLSALSAACHRDVDGLIGADFFAGRIVQIDFTREKIRLLAKSNPHFKAEVLPLQVQALRLRVPVEVVGLGKAWARLDTGCASALHWAVSSDVLDRQPSTQELGVGVTSVRIRQNNQSVRLGALTVEKVATGLHTEKLLAGEDGLLGAGLLAHFAIVTIDEPAGQLILEEYSDPRPHTRR
ncbi:MAG TPA: retropepsin-like aspartic protease [Candidatus Cybelea sp.]|jgi:hypothetical protein|nr:retropepsin-like aspartic protease [Candidatus Cybelea sp.]